MSDAMSDAMKPLPPDHPLMVAWTAYRATDEYTNTRRWALHDAHTDGSLWAAFCAGAATQAARIRELTERLARLNEERERQTTRALSAEQRLEKVLKVARHYTKNYLLDEYNEPRLCVSKEQHDALTELFKALS